MIKLTPNTESSLDLKLENVNEILMEFVNQMLKLINCCSQCFGHIIWRMEWQDLEMLKIKEKTHLNQLTRFSNSFNLILSNSLTTMYSFIKTQFKQRITFLDLLLNFFQDLVRAFRVINISLTQLAKHGFQESLRSRPKMSL